jgi:hypothetical protein
MQDLDRNMTQQGVTTVPKGHCSACAKPIVGQVLCGYSMFYCQPQVVGILDISDVRMFSGVLTLIGMYGCSLP